MRLLLLRGGALGDFIVTLPALAVLRAHWPGARIELAGNATAAALAVHRGLLDAAHSQNESRWSALYDAAPLPADFATWLASFDVILNFWPDPDGTLARHFPLGPAQRFLTAPAHPAIAPAAAHYCAPLRQLGVPATDFFYRLRPIGSSLSTLNSQLSTSVPYLALHPGSGSAKKNWPLARWLELAAWLKSAHAAELFIITGEAEPAATRVALSALGTAAHQLPLEDLVTQLASCRAFIGHDSGISHLAAACGVPSLLLFGPTDPAMWAPPAPHVHILTAHADLKDLSVAAVQAALASTLLAHK